MEKYEELQLEIIYFEQADVIVSSSGYPEGLPDSGEWLTPNN